MNPPLTALATPAAEARVRKDLERIISVVRQHVPDRRLRALALVGGFGRGEGGMLVPADGRPAPFNDYDLVIVADGPFNETPLRAAAPALARELGVDFVDFGVVQAGALSTAPPTIFWYEVREGHRVLHGPENALAALPRVDPARLPLEEATRLLVNRGLALLWARLHLDDALAPAPPLTPERRRFTVNAIHKAVLAAGDAALIRAAAYHLSYRERARRLGGVPLPFAGDDAARFLAAHAAATRFKLHPEVGGEPVEELAAWWERIRDWHERVFRWTEEARLGAPVGTWKHYARRMALESLRSGLRHPRRYLRERRTPPFLSGWTRCFLDPERSYRARLPFLLYSPGPEGLDARLPAEGMAAAGPDPAALKWRWREAAERLLAEWHP